ncbi:nicotinate (nicotinamide) nucleotide adenylyltransferase [Urechidicola vernalis]|uniref:Probable nicotinate-nucleotide adenylyltransferase n=1 Tax=Urechidicola vernalis TaxID=3075600 RepID=A0ABU2Y6A7_9FLAO|nr:nicotinate (nicotinamide) nucleotide adenylyltransferase [Urechidicola sp. P050]MDT0553729.1 nicotinate (nicotinamide) nucleotide adenylyltransferase [Urechidicola sp. P050]
MKVGLFFGSFNPIHIGHLIIANHFVEHSDLDQVWFVVTPHNPHKKKSSLLADIHRLSMVKIAVEDYPNLKASNIEFGLPQPNYTVNTLAHLTEKYPTHQFSMIMGEDNLNGLHKWKNYEILLENYSILIYPRVSKKLETSELISHHNIEKIEAPIIEISATLIRNSIKNNKNFKPLVPVAVWNFIDEMNFYKN